jgi:two-component system, OmpR family, response regulator VicR
LKFLIIEDDRIMVELISLLMRVSWPEVELITAENGKSGIALSREQSVDLIILDIGLPDMEGFDVLKAVRAFSDVPILVLTVRSSETDVVKAIELGANEYIIKPFRNLEFLARIKLLLRKQVYLKDEQSFNIGKFTFDFSLHRLEYDNKKIELTSTESLILYHLLRNRGQALSLSVLSQKIWGEDYPGSSDAIRVYIRHLRQKVEEDPGKPKIILTKLGVGYLIEKQ